MIVVEISRGDATVHTISEDVDVFIVDFDAGPRADKDQENVFDLVEGKATISKEHGGDQAFVKEVLHVLGED